MGKSSLASSFLNLGSVMMHFIAIPRLSIRLLISCKLWLRAKFAWLDDGPAQQKPPCPVDARIKPNQEQEEKRE